ncbi:MAG: Y-family DNA polymerase [Candidatus Kapabacteria bacterium]|nr:Y-family DNA polymerase [Candidatus Kapabacteria bacterium]
MIALVDCNNFYASCERIFQPWLRKRPVLVLSSNDGCVIARSQEAKDLGVPMGAPIHKLTELVNQYEMYVCSSNFTLYADISKRVMSALGVYSPHIEVYSIDESFLNVDHYPKESLLSVGRAMRQTVLEWTDIPTGIGIGPTKTLAKIANRVAKKQPQYGGVFVINSAEEARDVLQSIAVEDVWGVGRQWSRKLKSVGIVSALDLQQADDKLLRQKFNVVLLRTATELRGTQCLSMEEITPANKTIIASRSFGTQITKEYDIEEAVASFATRAAEKLRKQGSLALYLSVFVRTNIFNKFQAQYSGGTTVALPIATAYTPALVAAARTGIHRIYREGYSYKKAGIVLSGILPDSIHQQAIFHKVNYDKEGGSMKAMDSVNAKYGKGTLRVGAIGTRKVWHPKLEKRSKLYTTRYEDMLVVKA